SASAAARSAGRCMLVLARRRVSLASRRMSQDCFQSPRQEVLQFCHVLVLWYIMHFQIEMQRRSSLAVENRALPKGVSIANFVIDIGPLPSQVRYQEIALKDTCQNHISDP